MSDLLEGREINRTSKLSYVPTLEPKDFTFVPSEPQPPSEPPAPIEPEAPSEPTPAPSFDEVGCCCRGLEDAVLPTVLVVVGMLLLLIMCAARPAVPDGKTLRCCLHHQTPPTVESLVLAAEYIGVVV